MLSELDLLFLRYLLCLVSFSSIVTYVAQCAVQYDHCCSDSVVAS